MVTLVSCTRKDCIHNIPDADYSICDAGVIHINDKLECLNHKVKV